MKGVVPLAFAIQQSAECPLRVNFCRAISRKARLLYPTKLPRRRFAIEVVTGHFQTFLDRSTAGWNWT